MADHETFMGEVTAVLDGPPSDRALLERTLTDGYAHVLTLEAERSRVQRQLREVAASMERGDAAVKAKQLTELVRRIEGHEDTLGRLRELLGHLRNRYTEAGDQPAPRKRR